MLEFARKCMTKWKWMVAAVSLAASLGAGVMFWRGRAERHLARAYRSGAQRRRLRRLELVERAGELAGHARAGTVAPSANRGRTGGVGGIGPRAGSGRPGRAERIRLRLLEGADALCGEATLLAITWLVAAINRRPDDADSHRWLAAAAYDQGNRATAVSAIEAVTRLEPDDARAWRTLGMMFKEDVEYEQARTAFEKSLAIDGSQPAIRLELGEVLVKLGDVAGAERELAACQGRVPEARHAELLAACARSRGDLAGFRAAVESGLATAPDHPGLLLHRAQIDVDLGHPLDALEHLDRAASADPYRPETFYQRGRLLQQLGRTEEARRQLARADELNKGLAEMSDLNRQAERAPHDADVRYRLGRLCVELGKPELAASWYRAALACDPGHRDARLGLKALGLTVRASGRPQS